MEIIDLLTDERVLYYGFEGQKKPELSRLKPEFMEILGQINPHLILLGRHTSGIICSFETDSASLTFDVSLMRPSVMKHMTILAESGIDLYLGQDNDQQFYQSFGPESGKSNYVHTVSFQHPGMKHIILYFPLYNGINRLMVSVDGSVFRKKAIDYEQKIVIYGTSITQGACASRPGLSLSSLLSRALHAEVLNYGFSGNGLGEKPMIEMIASVADIDIFIIDYEANSGAVDRLMPTLHPMLDCIRSVYPKRPVIILGRVPSELERFDAHISKRRLKHRDFYQDVLKLRHDPHLYHLDGEIYFPNYLENMTVDGIHLNDLGFSQLIGHLVPYMKAWTNKEGI